MRESSTAHACREKYKDARNGVCAGLGSGERGWASLITGRHGRRRDSAYVHESAESAAEKEEEKTKTREREKNTSHHERPEWLRGRGSTGRTRGRESETLARALLLLERVDFAVQLHGAQSAVPVII